MAEPYERLDEALGAYAAAIRRHLVGIRPGEIAPIMGDFVLEDGLRAYLDVEMIPYTAEELIEIGWSEFEWIEAEFHRVSNEMGFGDDWQAALEHVKTLAPPPGEKPWATFEIAEYSENFVLEMGLTLEEAVKVATRTGDVTDPDMPVGSQVELAAPGISGSIKTRCLPPENELYCLGPGTPPEPPEEDECDPDTPPEECIRTLDGASSYAAALVSAAATLLFSHNPSWSYAEVRDRLRASALDLGSTGRDNQYGYGLVQAADALNYQMPDPPDVSIQGPWEIDPEATCAWDAEVTDGHEPLSYEWIVNGVSVGTDDHWTGGNPSGNTNSYLEIKVRVTDYLERTAQESITVQLDSNAPVSMI